MPVDPKVRQEIESYLRLRPEKLTDEDVTYRLPLFRELAHDFVEAYMGTFPFMIDIKYQIHTGRPLSQPQIRGVLNVLRAELIVADVQKELQNDPYVGQGKPKAGKPLVHKIPPGYYMVLGDAETPPEEYTLLVTTGKSGPLKGMLLIQQVVYPTNWINGKRDYASRHRVMCGVIDLDGNLHIWTSARNTPVEKAVQEMFARPGEASILYANLMRRCSKCNQSAQDTFRGICYDCLNSTAKQVAMSGLPPDMLW